MKTETNVAVLHIASARQGKICKQKADEHLIAEQKSRRKRPQSDENEVKHKLAGEQIGRPQKPIVDY